MKPSFKLELGHTSHDAIASRRLNPAAPKVEYSLQSPAPEFFGHRSGERRSFRSISQDYFEREARNHFKGEALFFGLIVLTAAVPMVEGVRGLAQLVSGLL